MQVAWRIVPARRAASAFTGEGARLAGGRWNSPGVPVIYTSANKSLAALELLVHVGSNVPIPYKAFRLEIADDLICSLAQIPKGWDVEPPGPASMRIGDRWCSEARTAALAVPSVIIPEEKNFVLNPMHPDFKRIKIGPALDFAFDSRLLR